MTSRALALGLVLGAAACGARTSLGTTTDAGPPPPAPCAGAIAATDWTACERAPAPDPRVQAAITCAHETATRGCAAVAIQYWSCLGAEHAACEAHDSGVPGGIVTTVPAPACDLALEQMANCLSTCSPAYACETEGWKDCHCTGAGSQPGEACSVYPTSTSLPDCNVACSACD